FIAPFVVWKSMIFLGMGSEGKLEFIPKVQSPGPIQMNTPSQRNVFVDFMLPQKLLSSSPQLVEE
ncbi:hypothetical protein KI387_025407, partial [Taxus chinensis]